MHCAFGCAVPGRLTNKPGCACLVVCVAVEGWTARSNRKCSLIRTTTGVPHQLGVASLVSPVRTPYLSALQFWSRIRPTVAQEHAYSSVCPSWRGMLADSGACLLPLDACRYDFNMNSESTLGAHDAGVKCTEYSSTTGTKPVLPVMPFFVFVPARMLKIIQHGGSMVSVLCSLGCCCCMTALPPHDHIRWLPLVAPGKEKSPPPLYVPTEDLSSSSSSLLLPPRTLDYVSPWL